MKNILRNMNLLNIILIVAIFIVAKYILFPFLNVNVQYKIPAKEEVSVTKEEKTNEKPIPSLTDYILIAEENLFHPERRIPAEATAEQTLEKPEFVLYGTVITDAVRLAYLEDLKAPRNTQGRGRRHTVVKIGDKMSGFILKEVYPDKVIMARGDEIRVVDLSSSKKRVKGSKTTSKKTLSPVSQMRKKIQSSIMSITHPQPVKRIPPYKKEQRY